MPLEQLQQQFPAARHHPILITEVTRMREGHYCVAGWDIHAGRIVRPLQPPGENWQLRNGCIPFAVGELIDVIPARHKPGLAPHSTEDFVLGGPPQTLTMFNEAETFTLLRSTADKSIRAIFGPLFGDRYLHEGTGQRSLGSILLRRERMHLFVDQKEKLRIQFTDGDGVRYALAVTSEKMLHYFSPRPQDPPPHYGIREAAAWLNATPADQAVMLRIGLSRGWAGTEKAWKPPRCYLQLNGIICPADHWKIFPVAPGAGDVAAGAATGSEAGHPRRDSGKPSPGS